MQLAVNQTRNIRSLFRDEHEGGFQKPCSATEVRITIDPPDLATVNGETITWARAGSGTMTGEATYADGVVRQAEGVIPLVCAEVVPPVTVQPGFQKTVIVDPDS